MKKNRAIRVFVSILVLLQFVTCTALADTLITDLTTFSAIERAGNYTVRFLTEDNTLIFEKQGVGYGTPMSDLLPELYASAPDYNDQTIWSVTNDYLVLNNVDITVQGEAVAL